VVGLPIIPANSSKASGPDGATIGSPVAILRLTNEEAVVAKGTPALTAALICEGDKFLTPSTAIVLAPPQKSLIDLISGLKNNPCPRIRPPLDIHPTLLYQRHLQDVPAYPSSFRTL